MWDKYLFLFPRFFLVSNPAVCRISARFLDHPLLPPSSKRSPAKFLEEAHYAVSERQPQIFRARVYEVSRQGQIPFLHAQH
jgi:hypothetical protein